MTMRHEPRNQEELFTQLHFFPVFFFWGLKKLLNCHKIVFWPANGAQNTCSLVEIHNTVQVPVQQYYYLLKINTYFYFVYARTILSFWILPSKAWFTVVKSNFLEKKQVLGNNQVFGSPQKAFSSLAKLVVLRFPCLKVSLHNLSSEQTMRTNKMGSMLWHLT